MSRRTLFVILFLLGLVAVARAQDPSQEAFTGYWHQVASNAGQCATCALTVSRTDGGYRVVASNGWNAEARRLSVAGVAAYAGGGHWERSPPRLDAGRRLAAQFVVEGDRLHLTLMLTRPDGSPWRIRAVFAREIPVA